MDCTSVAFAPDCELRIEYEWFAGWRWERHSNGVLTGESPTSFEKWEECVADAERRARAPLKAPVFQGACGSAGEHALEDQPYVRT